MVGVRVTVSAKREKLLCGRFASGHNGIASVTEGGSALTPWFEFTEVTQPVACELGTETQYVCEPLWRDWQSEIFASDAGVADAATAQPEADASVVRDAAVADAGEPRSDGCSVAALGSKANTHAAWATWVLAVLACAFERKRS